MNAARSSAQIIPLPSAAAEPVRQKNGPGRRPRHTNIITSHRWQFGHTRPRPKPSKENYQTDVQKELADALSFLQTHERIYKRALDDFRLLQQRARKNGGAA